MTWRLHFPVSACPHKSALVLSSLGTDAHVGRDRGGIIHQPDFPRTRDAPQEFQHDSSRSRFNRFIDRSAFVVGIIAPLSTVPQIIQIYTTRSAEDLNLGTWGLFLAFTVFWLLYGIVNRARPLIITNSIWLVSYVVVIIGAVIHG